MFKEVDRAKWEHELVSKCPNLYADVIERKGPSETLMCFGFEVGQGWYKIIEDLSIKLEAEILKQPLEDRKRMRAVQVKEKFASMRFYMHGSTDEMYRLIDEAEKLSEVTCEECGESGTYRDLSWKKTLCDIHYNEHIARRNNPWT
jgi:hypothetical protein